MKRRRSCKRVEMHLTITFRGNIVLCLEHVASLWIHKHVTVCELLRGGLPQSPAKCHRRSHQRQRHDHGEYLISVLLTSLHKSRTSMSASSCFEYVCCTLNAARQASWWLDFRQKTNI